MRRKSKSSWQRSSRSSRRSKTPIIVVVVVLLVVLVGGATFQLLRPVPSPAVQLTMALPPTVPGTAPTIAWPSSGEGIVEIPGIGVLGSFGNSQSIPIASVAKMMTALTIIKDHPLSSGESGPSVTISQGDYQTYQSQFSQQDSVMAVAPGEVLSEYQMLEALLIPSADNIAVTLANWDAGSVAAFVSKMNGNAKTFGLTATTYTDPSGLETSTVSNAKDQLKLAEMVENNPVLASIVSMPQATLPVAGVVYNVDYDLGTDGINGIKTGSTPQTGAFAFSAAITTAIGPTKVIGVILGQGGAGPLLAALGAGKDVVSSLAAIPKSQTVLPAGSSIGFITSPGRSPVALQSVQAVNAFEWPGLSTTYTFKKTIPPYPILPGTVVGEITFKIGEQVLSTQVKTAVEVTAPSLVWKLTRL